MFRPHFSFYGRFEVVIRFNVTGQSKSRCLIGDANALRIPAPANSCDCSCPSRIVSVRCDSYRGFMYICPRTQTAIDVLRPRDEILFSDWSYPTRNQAPKPGCHVTRAVTALRGDDPAVKRAPCD